MKTRIFILTLFALFLAGIFIITSGSSSQKMTTGTITCQLGTNCNTNTTWTATLYDKNGVSQGTCTISSGSSSCGVTRDFALSKYHWTIDNGTVLCTGSVFDYPGGDYTYTMPCGSNCVGY